jgi:hypothetical protein
MFTPSYTLAAVIFAVLIGLASCIKADNSGGVSIALFFVAIILGFCLGIGGCTYLCHH